ncbi:methyl-accepting chemotaxis protein [Aminirod propionatiphilus]|uniref:Methyl-accepting chemotaxis protein n=1 Tax=Aminirod propionatiphilus TaxID=3415223 RepID=A0ACD1DVS9_9BACT|nr:methyl-accepting chemotaxis protein [Synergistota bacterium]
MTIRNKLFAMALALLVMIAAMTVVTYGRSRAMLLDLVSEAGTEIVARAADAVDARFDKIAAIAVTATELVQSAWNAFEVRDEADVEALLADLLQRVRGEGVQDVYFGYAATGKVAVGSRWAEPDDYDARSRPWYREAVAAGPGAVIFTDPYFDPATQGMVLSVATPLYDGGGSLLGVMGTDVSIKEMSAYVEALRIFGKGRGLMLLGSGIVASGFGEEAVLKADLTKDEAFPESLRAIARRMIAGERGNAVYRDGEGEQQLFFAPTARGYFLGIVFPVSEITALVRGLTTILVVIAAVAVVLAGALLFAVVRGLTTAIGAMEATTARLGAGDLSIRYDDSGRDEIAHISRNLNAMVGSIGGVLTSIRQEADVTAQRSETLSALCERTLTSMEGVSRSVDTVRGLLDHNVSALEETNASIEEIASGAQSAARAAASGAEGAASASEASAGSLTEVKTVIGDIGKASDESRRAIEKIRALGQSVTAISGFVATITSIADQTNLLALNAAIEAARAGEAGRGFAVVAEEVRKLAEESAQAAREVNKLIDGLQRHSGDSVRATEETGRILGETLGRAEEAQTVLGGAVAALNVMVEAVQSVAAVAQEQAAASEEVTSAVQSVTGASGEMVRSVETIHDATAETTRAAEAIAAQAREMASASEKLRHELDRFTLADRSSASLPARR